MSCKSSRKSASKWTEISERALMKIWSENLEKLRGCRKNSHILSEMLEELETYGYFYSLVELKTKMHNMSARYRREKQKVLLDGEPSEWDLFRGMENLVDKSYNFEEVIIDSVNQQTEMAKLDEKIGFIGGGNMAFAIGSGLINRGIVKAGQVFCSGPNLENLERWRKMGVDTTEENNEVLDKSDIIFLCVKPHILTPCAEQLANNHVYTDKDKDKLFVSVLAGVNLRDLEKSFSFIERLKMIRTMPNTSIQVGEGCTVYTPGSYVVQQDLEKVHIMLNSLGIAQQVPESMINAVTGVSGCGPAFVYTIIEAMADGAVKNGVPRQMALQFATQTLLGAAKTVMVTGKHPAVLRDEVCSPGGATIVGVHELEKGNLRSTLINAVEKSSQRSAELGRKND